MNLSYMKAGQKPMIEIPSSPSNVVSVCSSDEQKSVDDILLPSRSRRGDKSPMVTPKKLSLTPVKQNLTPISKGRFDLSAIFAKKSAIDLSSGGGSCSNYDSNYANSHDKNNNNNNHLIKVEMAPAINEQMLLAELHRVHGYARDSMQNARDTVMAKEYEIQELKAFYVMKIRELTERVQDLMRENLILKEIQSELDKSAEKITLFRSEEKSLNICSYLYDSWKNRESKLELYHKYTSKTRAYDELLEKYTELESNYINNIQLPLSQSHQQQQPQYLNHRIAPQTPVPSKKEAPIATKPATVTPAVAECEKKKRGRKPKALEIQQQYEIVSDDDDEPKLTKKALLALERETSVKPGRQQAPTTPIKRPSQQQQQMQQQQQQQQLQTKKVLDEKTNTYQNNKNRQPSTQASTQPSRSSAATKANDTKNQLEYSAMQRKSQRIRKEQSSSSKEVEEDFDDNKSSTSVISRISNNQSKKQKKFLAKEKKKNMIETQETTFNSIVDTLFNF